MQPLLSNAAHFGLQSLDIRYIAVISLESTMQTNPAAGVLIIGIYGLPGSGKTFQLRQLGLDLGQEHFNFYEGSEVIDSVTPGGLDAFQKLEWHEKTSVRESAIEKIKQECTISRKIGVVAGHFMFWPDGDDAGRPVYTNNDLNTYTHIVYLDTPPETVVQRRQGDLLRTRPPVSAEHLSRWQTTEIAQLRQLCREHKILFFVLSSKHSSTKLSQILRHFQEDTDDHNSRRIQGRLAEVLSQAGSQAETTLVLDGDKTLAPEDTGKLFWDLAAGFPNATPNIDTHPLQTLFSSPHGYSSTAFRQAVLLYEEIADHEQFESICEAVATSVSMHAEFVALLQEVAKHDHVIAMVITCGLRVVWEKVLRNVGLASSVAVIGSGSTTDGMLVTPAVKADLVRILRDGHHLYTWAFGDSVLDLPMMGEAHRSIVVVGDDNTRSKSMDAALSEAIDKQQLYAHQALLPSHASPRLDRVRLPLIKFVGQELLECILRRRAHQFLDSVHPDSAKILATDMRNAALSGPALRAAHQRVGWYLAITFLPGIVGLEPRSIEHVQGHRTAGHQLQDERQTSIFALMRGGEAMAFGVNHALPLATFVHANTPENIGPDHVRGFRTIVLVDSVVNSGKTLAEFVKRIRKLHATIRIVVIAGVVQAESSLLHDANLVLVALRRSDNKFVGKGTTDTGNRLFNTTHLE